MSDLSQFALDAIFILNIPYFVVCRSRMAAPGTNAEWFGQAVHHGQPGEVRQVRVGLLLGHASANAGTM